MGNSISHAKQLAITRIQAKDVSLGIRRVPVGFYVSVHYDGAEWRTTNKPTSVDADAIEWDDILILPEKTSTSLRFKLVASFELSPTLGNGEQLREFSIPIKDLMDRSKKALPITFSTTGGELISSCSSIFITTERRRFQHPQVCQQYILDSVMQSLADITDEGQNALLRYRKSQKQHDLELSIERFTHALDACPFHSPYFPVVLFNLAMAKFISCQANNTTVDTNFDIPITLFRDALNLRPAGHPDRPATLLHLSVAFLSRFNTHRDQADADEVAELLSQLSELCPSQSYEHRSAIVVRGIFTGDPHTTLVTHTFDGDPSDSAQSDTLFNPDHSEDAGMTALSHLERFRDLGEITDLTAAITSLRDVVQFTKDDDPNKVFWLMNLAMSLSMRFELVRDLSDLSLSISTLDDLVGLCPDDNNKAGFQNNLGYLLRMRFEHLGDIADIMKSVLVLEEAVWLTPDDRPNRLDNLATSLRARFDQRGDPADIQKSISLTEDAIRLTPNGHPNKARALCTLATSLHARLERLGDAADIDRSIVLFEEGIGLTPDDHPDKANRLNSFGGSLLTRFQRFGDIADLGKSISVLRDAVRLTPDGRPGKPDRIGNLGYTLLVRFNRLGDLTDLQKSITLLEDAMQLADDGLEKASVMGNLSNAWIMRFEHLGDVADIDRAVSLFEDAAPLIPKGHPYHHSHLENLSRSLWRRYLRLEDLLDLQRSISVMEDAIELTPDGHPSKPGMLSSLGATLFTRFDLNGERAEIDKAVSLQEEACSLTPDDHPDKPGMLSNLATAYTKRFDSMGEHADNQNAISRYEEALLMLPGGHSNKAGLLNNLGRALCHRFLRLGDMVDIDKSISFLEEAIRLTPDSHPSWSLRVKHLGDSFSLRYDRFQESADLGKVLFNCSLAARSSTGTSTLRFDAARVWITTAHLLSRNTLEAYGTAISLLPHLAWIGLPLKDRHRALVQAADVARDAAAAALELGHTQTAVEWLEQGRSIVWSQFLQLRNRLDELREAYPTLAARLHRVSNDLEKASARKPPVSLGQKGDMGQSLEREAQRHRALAKERDELLTEIQSLPGFERFLLPKTFGQLTAAARSGPVVILNAGQRRCDALIVTTNPDDLIHVPLPDITYSRTRALENMLTKVLANGGRQVSDSDRGARLVLQLGTKDTFKLILSELWRNVVEPVLEKLGFLTPGELRRIFWCPTGPFAFLPIHAAGLYDGEEPGVKASDFVVSSYTPTLGALVLPRQDTTTGSLRIVAVPQPDSDGQIRLPGARREIDQVQAIIENTSCTNVSISLVKSTGTIEDVLDKMKDSNWVHFACHGVQDTLTPLDSGLMLADQRRLKLSDIIKLSRPRGGFAFLSACQTATGDRALAEEAVHLAAGMLLAGYNSVVATMWSIGDSDAPEVAKSVYEQLFRDGAVPDATEAARALHDAVEQLRQRGAPFFSWVPFIHIGL